MDWTTLLYTFIKILVYGGAIGTVVALLFKFGGKYLIPIKSWVASHPELAKQMAELAVLAAQQTIPLVTARKEDAVKRLSASIDASPEEIDTLIESSVAALKVALKDSWNTLPPTSPVS